MACMQARRRALHQLNTAESPAKCPTVPQLRELVTGKRARKGSK